jgi:hypothetical protein
MPYDFQRGLKVGVAAAGIAYVGSGVVSSLVDMTPFVKDSEGLKPVVVVGVTAMAADALVQSFL